MLLRCSRRLQSDRIFILHVLAALKKCEQVLHRLDPDSPFLDDAEIVRLAVKKCPSELLYVSECLRGERKFILSLVKIDGRSLSYADEHLRLNDDVLTAAVANYRKTILNLFDSRSSDDFERIVLFASRVRSKLELHHTFVNEFLRCISVVGPQEAPANRCRL